MQNADGNSPSCVLTIGVVHRIVPCADGQPIRISLSEASLRVVRTSCIKCIGGLDSVFTALQGILLSEYETHGVLCADHFALQRDPFHGFCIVALDEDFVERAILGLRIAFVLFDTSLIRPSCDLAEACRHTASPMLSFVAVDEYCCLLVS